MWKNSELKIDMLQRQRMLFLENIEYLSESPPLHALRKNYKMGQNIKKNKIGGCPLSLFSVPPTVVKLNDYGANNLTSIKQYLGIANLPWAVPNQPEAKLT